MQCEKLPMHRALRGGPRTRSGAPCQSPAVRGKRRCRMHGGAAGTGAPFGNKNAFRHGHYTAEAIVQRRVLAELLRLSRATDMPANFVCLAAQAPTVSVASL